MAEQTSSGSIRVTVNDGVAAVMIDNPSQRNALTRSMCLRLQELMPELDADAAVTVVTLRGAGDAFSAGATINDLTSVIMDKQDDGTEIDQLSRADQAIASFSKPTIALVDGVCMGGGWQIASACDFIIASDRAVFAITPAKIGILYPRAGIERLVRQVGHANAKYILLTADVLDSARAMELGLVAETVPAAKFETRCTALVDDVRSRSRFSTYYMKRLVNLTAANAHELEQEWASARDAMTESPDMRIGIEAFLNRETPQFSWSPS
ncbi:MAG TPA: enoyl-CoA hydratase/isomerase family protein [Galbitalea sp.]|jgi:enoyl-CoA hydratase/carnithine racemase|nr:enoyl-CoA hydratase/isomerase family protein [Galbitalea sp.]